jgi:hypothetical protein
MASKAVGVEEALAEAEAGTSTFPGQRHEKRTKRGIEVRFVGVAGVEVVCVHMVCVEVACVYTSVEVACVHMVCV